MVGPVFCSERRRAAADAVSAVVANRVARWTQGVHLKPAIELDEIAAVWSAKRDGVAGVDG